MRSDSQRDLSVYDFNAADEATFTASNDTMKKFNLRRNPRAEVDPLSKYDFLRFFSGDAYSQHGQTGNDGREGVSVTSSLNHKDVELDDRETSFLSKGNLNFRDTCGGHNELNDALAASGNASDENAVKVTSDDDECSRGSSLSSSVSHTSEDDGDLECMTTDRYCHGDCEKTTKWQLFHEEAKREEDVIVCTDFVRYGDKVCAETMVTFSLNHIKLEDLSASEHDKVPFLEVALSEINCIEWYWLHNVAVAYLIVHISSTFKPQIDKLFGAKGLAKLEFTVSDSQWFQKMQIIMSLSERYGKIWKLDCDCLHISAELTREVDECIRERTFGLNGYSDGFPDSFEDLIFPKGDPDAVSISRRDVELLQPDTFINDTVIDFYIKYMQSKLKPEEKNRFHFFNSFFFRKLADLDKNPGSAFESKLAFQRVKKWTRKVDIFKKDYIFIPVNFNLHWSLIVVCHPGETAHLREGEIHENDRVPCILHMDSIKGSHRGLKNLVQSYLWEEWKERHMEIKESVLDDEPKFCNMRFVPLEVPQQENSSDCGLFLLHYVELFLKEAPLTFNPFNITKFSNFLNKDWFPPAEASLKRLALQKLIFELLEGHPQEVSPVIATDSAEPVKLSEENCEDDLELVSDRCVPAGLPLEHPLEFHVGNGGVSSNFSTAQEDEELGYPQFFGAGTFDSNSAGGQFHVLQDMVSMQQVDRMMMEMECEADCQVPDTPSSSSEGIDAKQELCTISSKSESSVFEQSASGQWAEQPKSCTDRSPSCESSSCASQLQHNSPQRNLLCEKNPPSLQQIEEPQDPSHRLPANQNQGTCGTCKCTTADDDTIVESKGSAESYFSCPENGLISSNRDADSLATAPLPPFAKKETELELSGDGLVSADSGSPASMPSGELEVVDLSEDSDQPHHKRLKLTMPERRRCTRSVGCSPEYKI